MYGTHALFSMHDERGALHQAGVFRRWFVDPFRPARLRNSGSIDEPKTAAAN